jgi:hypothetical protein
VLSLMYSRLATETQYPVHEIVSVLLEPQTLLNQMSS